MVTFKSQQPFYDKYCDSIQLDSRDEGEVWILNSQGLQRFGVGYTDEDEKKEAIATCTLSYLLIDFVYEYEADIVNSFFNTFNNIGSERVFITSELVDMINKLGCQNRIRQEILEIVN